MEISSSTSSYALQGMQQSQLKVNKSATDIASTEAMQGTKDISQPVVNMKESSYQFSAASKVLSTDKEMTGTLLNIKA